MKKDDLDLSKGKNASKEKQHSKKYPLESPQRVGRRKLRDEKKRKKKRSGRAGSSVIQKLKGPEARKMTNAFELRRDYLELQETNLEEVEGKWKEETGLSKKPEEAAKDFFPTMR